MKKSSLIQRYRRDIKEIDKELLRIHECNNPPELNYIVERITSRKTTLLEVIEDIENLEVAK